jgi:tRNA A-37 threonylcarbamoyl transferase component Bud32/tetratricopeptide (TPR) repeat protein
MIGQEISHYRILEKIGEGGMGVVYKAEDLILKRNVALKFLSNEALGSGEENERFLREARAAAALDHPAICTIYEVARAEGKTFLAMAYLEGETLRQRIEKQPLDAAEAVPLVIQVLEGLQEAHEEGIVHRDIKSANIMFTAKGRAKIMDFGLAQLPGAARITQIGTTLGTAAYMSPQQAEGLDVDHRSDLWSAGVVLYEVLTGGFPFNGSYIPALMYAIVHEEPQPLESLNAAHQDDLRNIIAKALSKAVDQRYQSASEMAADLAAFQQEHGMTVAGFGAAAKSGQQLPVASAAPASGVDTPPAKPEASSPAPDAPLPAQTKPPWAWALAGVVTTALAAGLIWFFTQGAREAPEPGVSLAEVTTETPVAASADVVPAEEPDSDTAPPAAVSPAPPREAPSTPVSPPPPAVKSVPRPASSLAPDSSQAALGPSPQTLARARRMLEAGGARDLQGAIGLLQPEVKIHPGSAELHALLAKAHALVAFNGHASPSEELAAASGFASKALAVDDSSADAQLAQGIVLALKDWNWAASESAFQRALAAAPDSPQAHQYYALAYLAPQGRLDEALAEIKRAIASSAADPDLQTWLGRVYSFRGEHDKAVTQLRKTVQSAARHPASLWGLGMAYAAQGDLALARESMAKMIKMAPGSNYAVAGTAYIEALGGGLSSTPAQNRRTLKNRFGKRSKLSAARKRRLGGGSQYVSPYWRAIVEVARGRKDEAFKWLDQGVSRHDAYVARAKVQPELASLRSDPRYKALLAKMNLTP